MLSGETTGQEVLHSPQRRLVKSTDVFERLLVTDQTYWSIALNRFQKIPLTYFDHRIFRSNATAECIRSNSSLLPASIEFRSHASESSQGFLTLERDSMSRRKAVHAMSAGEIPRRYLSRCCGSQTRGPRGFTSLSSEFSLLDLHRPIGRCVR